MPILNTKVNIGQGRIGSSDKGQQWSLPPVDQPWTPPYGTWHLVAKLSLPRCTHCLSISHKSGECELSSDTHMTSTPYPTEKVVPGRPSLQNQCPICYAWNKDPAPGYPRRGCRYEHICYLCSKDARIQNQRLKAIHCPHHIQVRPTRPPRPQRPASYHYPTTKVIQRVDQDPTTSNQYSSDPN